MAKAVYYGKHSVTFDVDGDKRHTWEDWHLVPVTGAIPTPAIPQPKTNFKDIPGSDGQLDYTEVLAGLKYQMRQGSWEFYIIWNGKPWADRLSEIIRFIQGKRCHIVLDDDPNYYYVGRVAVNNVKPDEKFSTITFDYVVDPYRYPIAGTAEYDWPWDNLVIDGSNTNDYNGNPSMPFGNIIYGTFDVEGTKIRTFINSNDEAMPISITTSSNIQMIFNGEEYDLQSGTHNQVITIQPGENEVEFRGYGRVVVDYGFGKIL